MISFNLVQLVYIQYLGPNSYRLIDTNYSQATLDRPITLKTVDTLAIMDDIWLHKINNIIVNQYGNLFGTHPSIMSIAQEPPYYRVIYQNGDKNYAFFVQYDYLQDRILQGNITIQQQTTTTQQTTTSSSQQGQPSSQSTTNTTQSTSPNGATQTTTQTTTTKTTSLASSQSGSASQTGSTISTASLSRSTEYASLVNLQQNS